MQTTKEEIEALLVSMGLDNIAFNLPIKKQIDSLDKVALVIAVEDQWQISITDEEQSELVTFDDLIKLIHSKTIEDETSPSIDQQIEYIEGLRHRGNINMIKFIKENLIVIKLQMKIRETAKTMRPLLGDYPIPYTDVEPPFTHPSGHSFTEGHDI